MNHALNTTDSQMAVREVKVCLLGDSGVGKSSIVLRFVRDQYKESLESTIGASFMSKRIEVDGNAFTFQIWDTAGQEKYRALAPMYYRGASAAIVVYDVTRESSLPAVKEWVRELNKNAPGNIVVAIAGNKCDLEDLREVSIQNAREYASNINAIFTETSALTAANIHELFKTIARKLPAEDIFRRQPSTVYMRNRDMPGRPRLQKKRSCCTGDRS